MEKNRHKHIKEFFGYIPQNTFIFDDTIKNNILLANNFPDNLFEKIFEILETTKLKKFINSLPEKENTLLGENGSRISGGQKQRIGIARALMFNPKVLIFDEATSGLDKETEEMIFENLEQISKTNSIIVISHNSHIKKYCKTIYKLSEKNFLKCNEKKKLKFKRKRYCFWVTGLSGVGKTTISSKLKPLLSKNLAPQSLLMETIYVRYLN